MQGKAIPDKTVQSGRGIFYFLPVVDVETLRAVKLAFSHTTSDHEFATTTAKLAPTSLGDVTAIATSFLIQACLGAKQVVTSEKRTVCFPISVCNIGRPLLNAVEQALMVANLTPQHLELTINASELAVVSKETKRWLADLSRWGVGLALSDFGGQQASLECFEEIDFTTVLLDASIAKRLARPLHNPHYPLLLLRSVLEIASLLDTTVVACGIDSKGQLEQFHALGCLVQQGSVFGPPIPVNALYTWAAPESLG